MARKGKTRVVSLGLLRPSKLDKDTIYVDFRYDHNPNSITYDVLATAYSNEDFRFPTKDLRGKSRIERNTEATNLLITNAGSQHLTYTKFIQRLVKLNKSTVDNSRLIEDSSRLITTVSEVKKALSDL